MTDPSGYIRERHNDGSRDVRWPAAPEPLRVPVYDNHAHLEIIDGDEPLDLDAQLARARAVGVIGVVHHLYSPCASAARRRRLIL